MFKSILKILLFLLYLRDTSCECIVVNNQTLLYPTNPSVQLDLDVPDQVLQYKQNIGYGVWTKYQPFAQISDLRNRDQQIEGSINKINVIQGGQFIYSMKQKENSISILVVSLVIDQTDQKFQYIIYYSFSNSSNVIQFNTNIIIEGLWVMFYAYYDLISKTTTFGLYNSQEPLKTQKIQDVPSFVYQIRHNIGGINSYKNKNGDLVQFMQFFGWMSNLFISNNQNTSLSLEQCINSFIDNNYYCYYQEYHISKKNQRMNGQGLIWTSTSILSISIYQIQGWIKLDLSDLTFLETTVLRITINYNYSDDSYIGDREVLLKYFQSSVPGENGFEISTYSYTFPVKSRYKTKEDDKISQYGDWYSKMFITWHYFSYEIGTLNNDGQPLFTLYFPSINQYDKYIWNKTIKHFSRATYYTYIGGDNYTKSYLKGYVSDILFQLYCQAQATLVVAGCDNSCLDCDGPTSENCLSCRQNRTRYFSKTGGACNCQEGFVDANDQNKCLLVTELFSQFSKQEIQMQCNSEGYSRCEGQNIECNFGYFLYQNHCVKCPEQGQSIDGIYLSCFNCLTNPITFGQSLTCTTDAKTFYFNSQYSYDLIYRDNNQVSFYEIQIQDDQTYITKLCVGCIGNEQCKPGYYFTGDECFPCFQNCLICLNSYICGQCQDGYYLSGNNHCLKCPNCKKCWIADDLLKCSECEDNQTLQNNECVSCGQNCNSCDKQGYCNFCIGDPSKQYLTLDGRSCRECNIENCIYCYEYAIISGQYSTTLDVNFNIYNFTTNQVTIACALCKKNYNFNQNTNKCELQLTNDDCEFALILASTFRQVCIISLKNNNAVQVTSCSSLQHCKYCIHQYITTDSYCIQCEDGYYSEVQTGQCLLCTNNCKTCLQQNRIFKDYWKWSVKALRKYFSNLNPQNSFEDQGQVMAQSDLEVICTSCQLQYILYEQQCIKGCEKNCNQCEIIDGMAMCIQCQETDSGFLKSKNANGVCLQCPSNCNACVERNQKEISNINPYYIYNDENAVFTRKCYEKSKKLDNQYYDFLTQTISVCTNYQYCYNKYLVQQNVFCDYDQYFWLLNKDKSDQFKQQNILLGQFYSSTYLNNFESQLLYKYLNGAQVRQMEFQFTLIQGNQSECSLNGDMQLYSLLQQHVFTLQQVDVIFQGQTSPTILRIFNEIHLSNYTQVTFKDIQFNFVQTFSNKDQFFITLINFRLELILNFENCIFTMPYSTKRNNSLSIRSNFPYSLVLQNFTIIDFHVSSSEIFTFISQENTLKNSIQISNLLIRDSFFYNSTFFKFQANYNNLPYYSLLNYITIFDTIFFSSSFITSQGLLNYTTGSLFIHFIVLLNVQIQQNSTFLLSSGLQSLSIFNLTLENTKIIQNSNFVSSNIINFKDGIINNTQIKNSSLINNLVQYSKSELALQSCSKAQIDNYRILNTQYDDKQQIIKLIKYNEIGQLHLNFTTFSFLNGQLVSEMQQQEISCYSSIIYFECQLCYLQNITLLRGHGLPEMTLLYSEFLDIKNFKISTNQIYLAKSLHSSFQCVEKFAYKNMHFFLYIGLYQIVNINSLDVSGSLSINTPFVILQGYDLMQRLQSEMITVFDVKFYSNLLLITDSNKQTALLSIISQQNCSVILEKLNYTGNHLNEYFQDQTRVSATTAFIQLYQGYVLISNSDFCQNIVTNSSNSILYIKSTNVELSSCQFSNSNDKIYNSLIRHMLYSEFQDFSSINLLSIFPIKSLSGNGMIIAQSLILDKVFINRSYATSGGGFHIITQGNSQIVIVNSSFQNTFSLSDTSTFSIGGCLCIDGSVSKLKVIIKNTQFQESFSRNEGGAIYILPSKSYNCIEFEDLIVSDCFSQQNSFFSFNPPNKESLHTQIIFKNINFYSTKQGFDKFIQSINRLTEYEAFQVAYSNPQIYIHYGFISLINCIFISSHFQYLIQIKQAYNINLQNITIQNSTFLSSPLIELNLKEDLGGQILIENLKIQNVDEFDKSIKEECQKMESTTSSQLECPLSQPQISWQNQQIDNTKTIQKLLICNLLLIFKNKPSNLSLVTIKSIKQTHLLIFQNINIQNVICNNCRYGVFQILDISQQRPDQILFSSIKIQNCVCGQIGCLSIIKNSSNLTFNNQIYENNRILQHNKIEAIEFLLNAQAIISNGKFKNNSALYGGSLFIEEINILIKNSLFYNNSAEIGGAIYYFSDKTQLNFYRNQFLNNTAQIAGAVYFKNQSLQLTHELEIEFADNNSTQFGNHVIENPRSLSISIDGGKTILQKELVKKTQEEIIEQITVTPYKILGNSSLVSYLTLPSGRSISSYEYFDPYTNSFIPYNLTFRIIALDKFNNQNKGFYDSSCTLKSITFNLTSQQEVTDLVFSLSKYHIFFDNFTGDFNLDDLIIYWNPNNDRDLILRISIQCNHISVPFYFKEPPYEIQGYNTNYKLLVDIRTFQCQIGEFLNTTTGGCVLCDKFQNQYQVIRNAQHCSFKDDTKIRMIESSMIELRPRYWRAYIYSQNIEYCYNMPKNCQGGWQPGDNSCLLGHIGALCEQCDLYDSRGQGSFYLSSAYTCLNCKISFYNILSIIFVIFWTLLTTLISVSSTIQMIKEFITGLRLRLFGVQFPIKQISSAILIKVLTNYLQIISTLFKFQLQLPTGLSELVSSCASPIESIAFSLDCYLGQFPDILIIYLRIIWSFIMALSFIILFIGLGELAIAIKLINHNFSFLTISVIYLFIFLQPSLVGQLISLLSYRQISDELWISSNVAYRYDTSTHLKWIVSLDIPMLAILGIAIPTILWYGVYKNRRNLDKTITRKKWGYLYHEYTKNAYYWETIKIFQKEMIILVRIYYDDYVTIKASLIFLLLFSYSHFAKSINPYMTKQLNNLDQQSIIICAVSIVLACSIRSAQEQNLNEIIWPFYVIIGGLNSFYISKLVFSILYAYLKRIFDKIDNLKQRILGMLPQQFRSNPKIQKIFETRSNQLTRIQKRFHLLKQYLLAVSRENLKMRKSKQEEFLQRENSQQFHKMILQYSLKGASKYSDNNIMQSQNLTFHNCSRISLRFDEEHENQFQQIQKHESQIL